MIIKMLGKSADDKTTLVIQLSVLSRWVIPLLIFHNENNTLRKSVAIVDMKRNLPLTNEGDAETKDLSQSGP